MSQNGINFKNSAELTPDSKVFIYQSKRDFSEEEFLEIEKALDKFMNSWNRKSNVITADYKLLNNRFIVVAALKDFESDISCGLDTPINNVIKRLDKKLNLGLVKPMQISYKINDEIQTVSFVEFRKRLANDEIPEEAIVFHTGAHRLEDFEKNWEMPLNESWVREVLNPIS